MCGILHYILDDENPVELVGTLYRALPPGSYVMIHHLLDMEDRAGAAALCQAQMRGGPRAGARNPDEGSMPICSTALELVKPGLVLVPRTGV